jgi:hypothetical protein
LMDYAERAEWGRRELTVTSGGATVAA